MTTPETIYLLELGDEVVWCDQPDPEQYDLKPVRYVRADVVQGIFEALQREANKPILVNEFLEESKDV